MTLHLGIDIGSTRTKVIAWDDRDGIVARASAPTPVISGDVDRRDHDQVWRVVSDLMSQVPAALRDRAVGVAVASVGEEIVLLDADGSSLGPTPCWYTLSERRLPESPDTAILSWQLFADLRASDRSLLAAAASFTDLAGWICLRIAGGSASDSVMDRSHASRTGLLDTTGEWDAAALAASGASLVDAPPRLVESGSRIGTVNADVAAAWGLPADLRVHAGGHDHFCGALAAGVGDAGDVFVSVGTSESIVQLVDRPHLAGIPEPGEHGYFVRGGLGYLHRSQPSGKAVAALLGAHGSPDIDALYAEIEDRDPAALSPAAAALDAEIRRQAKDSARLIHALTVTSGVPARRIVIGGVPAGSPHWRAVRQEALDVEPEFVLEAELAGIGAAMLATAKKEDDR
ncbi:FGGY family carbohydrate kinase [Microbacterium paraoxydans]|uniref:FGGY family carbohydrate kinase n=1 Tax=Microbacterium paraoxydans TaxID=199592 RepID=UPI00046AC381|nr:FGGY family carbohydrate kinase [Microbacterium paraoxydans]